MTFIFRMLVFDVPSHEVSPFEERYQFILANLHIDNPCVVSFVVVSFIYIYAFVVLIYYFID